MPEWPYITESQDLPEISFPQRREPLAITAGDTIDFVKFFTQFPPSAGWSLKYSLRGVPGSIIDFTSALSGDGHECKILPAVTALWAPGKYSIQGYAIGPAAERHTIYEGFLEVRPNLAANGDADLRSHARRCLDSIEAVLEGRATNDVLESSIEGTMIRRLSVADLLLLRDRYRAEVRSEERDAKARDGRATGRNILVRFTPAGR